MDNLTVIEGADDAAIARWMAGVLAEALAAGGPVAITVPGGTTPFPILDRLIGEALDWHRVTVWPNDDRLVGEDHPASNTARIRAAFAPTAARIVTLGEAETVPRFALAWLGMGEDGHVASLFPSSDPRVDEPAKIVRLTPDPLPPEAPFDRISLTLPALLASDRIVLVIRGAAKRRVFAAAAAGDNDLPIARLLAAARQPVTCFV